MRPTVLSEEKKVTGEEIEAEEVKDGGKGERLKGGISGNVQEQKLAEGDEVKLQQSADIEEVV